MRREGGNLRGEIDGWWVSIEFESDGDWGLRRKERRDVFG